MVTRHERGSTAGSGGLQEGFRLGADAMDRRDAPERSARRAAVAVCSTVGLLDCWTRIKTDLLLKRLSRLPCAAAWPSFRSGQRPVRHLGVFLSGPHALPAGVRTGKGLVHAHSERLLRASPWMSRLAASTQSERSIAQAVGSLGLRRRPVWPHGALRGPTSYSGLAQSQGHPGQPALQQNQRGHLQIEARNCAAGAGGLLPALSAARWSSLCLVRMPAARGRSPMPHRVYTSPATLHHCAGARRNSGFDGRSPCYQQPTQLNQANWMCLDSFAPCKA